MVTRERIEEFRRRLRRGDPVQVKMGDLSFKDERAPGANGTPATPAERAAPSVDVKPHEWGGW